MVDSPCLFSVQKNIYQVVSLLLAVFAALNAMIFIYVADKAFQFLIILDVNLSISFRSLCASYKIKTLQIRKNYNYFDGFLVQFWIMCALD